MGDRVVMDYKGTIDGEVFSGGEAEQTPVELGSGSLIDGFEEGLVGLKAGDEKDLEISFPDDYKAKDVAGRQAVFHVRVGRVEEARLPEIDERQRLALVPDGGELRLAAVIVDPEDPVDGAEVRRLYERIQKFLLERYGRPARVREEGEWPQNPQEAVNGRQLVRLTEWDLDGGVLRLGIPRRLDRRVRIEIQFAAGFPPETETLWSIETVR